VFAERAGSLRGSGSFSFVQSFGQHQFELADTVSGNSHMCVKRIPKNPGKWLAPRLAAVLH
jgi:hypothetical protein